MRRRALALLLMSPMAGSGVLIAQDWVASAPAHKQVLVDNPHFRLVDITIAPGKEEPVHTHPEYVEYIIDAGKLTVTYTGKPSEPWNPERGKAYYGKGEPPHSLKNVDSKPVRMLLLELKDRPLATSSTDGRE